MKYFWIALVVAAAAVLAWLLMPKSIPGSLRAVSAGQQTFQVEVADTDALRQLGLGNRASLPAGRGMLFIFQTPGNWGFWMKDTEFPLDMLWARQDGTITTIARNVATSSYPQVFYPATPDAAFVLEVNAGAAKDISVGEKLML